MHRVSLTDGDGDFNYLAFTETTPAFNVESASISDVGEVWGQNRRLGGGRRKSMLVNVQRRGN